MCEEQEGNIEFTCTCPAFAYHKNACKHIAAVMIGRKMRKEVVSIAPLVKKVMCYLQKFILSFIAY